MGDYHKVSTTYYGYFNYDVSGLVDADFTKQVDRNGTAGSTTGVTIAQIGSTRSYAVTVNGTTGFVNTTGQYNLQVWRTSVPADRWTVEVRVTVDGTGAGTTGLTGFTSTASNGRVVDSGATPLANARIIFNRPSGGAYYTSALTLSDGNWGPIYFDTDGSWPFTVQLSGYSVGSGTVTVSGGIPTGPGADITLTAVSASGLTLSALLAYARRMFRDRTGSKTDAELTQAVNDALMMLATEHEWPWFQTVGRINIIAAYSTGNVAISNGGTTVTLTGGSFPYTTIGTTGPAELYINGMYHRLASITNATTATLVNAWKEASYSGGYLLAQVEYTLPSDLRQLSKVTANNQWIWGPNPVSRFMLEEARQTWSPSATSPPRMWAIERDRIVIWPPPSADRMANLLYLRKPAELVSSTDTADWDSNLKELLFRAIDYQVACRGDCVAGDKSETYKSYRESMARNIDQDRTATSMRPGLQVGVIDELRYPGNTITG